MSSVVTFVLVDGFMSVDDQVRSPITIYFYKRVSNVNMGSQYDHLLCPFCRGF